MDITNSLAEAMRLPGAVAVGLVDMDSARCLAGCGVERLDLDAAAEGNTAFLRAEMRLLQEMGVRDRIEELLVTSGPRVHLLRPVCSKGTAGLFLFLALDCKRADLGYARYRLAQIERELVV
jgi:hypothetical protein